MVNKQDFGALVLRITLGIIFFVHGIVKFQSGIDNIAGWFSSIGLPGVMAYGVALLEVVGGIALIIRTRNKTLFRIVCFVNGRSDCESQVCRRIFRKWTNGRLGV